MHELLHAAGEDHSQKRLDYDEFVTWLKKDLKVKKACYSMDKRMSYLLNFDV